MTREKRRSSRKQAESRSARLRDTINGGRRALGIRSWQWWLLASAVPTVLLASRLTLDLWGDEVYTLYHFAAQPVSRIVTDYSAPNNHILYSLVLHPLAVITQSEPVLRLPSFLFGMATLAIVFDLARRLAGLTAAVAATLVLGLNVMFLTHAIQLRGYGLSMLLAAGLMWLALPPDESTIDGLTSWRRWLRPALVALTGGAFLYVIPTNALFLAPLCLAAIAQLVIARGAGRSLPDALGWLAAWPLAWAIYWPVIDEVRAASGPSTGLLPLHTLFRLAGDVYWAAGHDLVPLVIGLPVVIYRVIRAQPWRSRTEPSTGGRSTAAALLLLLLLAMLLSPFVGCWLLGMTPFERNFTPLLPALALAVGWYAGVVIGDSAALFRTPDPRPALPWLAMLMIAAVLLLPVLRYPSKLEFERSRRFAQDGYYNYYAANFEPLRVADYLRDAIAPNDDSVLMFAPSDHYDLVYYLTQAGLWPPSPVAESSPGWTRAKLFVVAPDLADWSELSELTGVPVEELRKFPQVDRVGYFRIYASPGPVDMRSVPIKAE